MLYSLGKGSYSMLARTNGTIYNWVTEAATVLPDAETPQEIKEIEFDEMWHYIVKKTKTVGHQGS